MGEDGRVPPLSRRVPGATDRDRATPVPLVTSRRLPESLLQRMQAAIDAAPERAAWQEQAARPERPAALPPEVQGASDDQRPPVRPASSASSLAGTSAPEADTQPIPIISVSASRGSLNPAVEEVSAQPEPAWEPELEPAAEPEPEPEPAWEPEPAVEPEPAAEPEPEPAAEPEPEPAAEPEPGAEPWADREPEPALSAQAERPTQRISGRKERASRRFRVSRMFAVVIVLLTIGLLAFALPPLITGRTASPDVPGTEVATRNLAAAWVAAQVSRAATVSCDPVMCRALEAHRFPAGDLLQLTPKGGNPSRSNVIVATPAIRNQFGRRLSSVYAPAVLASLGSGNLRIDIRVIAPHGAAAYKSALRADLRDRRTSGTGLLQSGRVVASATATRQLSAGQVDSRLLFTIEGMAMLYPVRIVAFGDSSPGASAGIPLRSADLVESDEPPGTSSATFMQSMRAFLLKQPSPYLPARVETVRLAGQTVLSIEFAAPSPLRLITAP